MTWSRATSPGSNRRGHRAGDAASRHELVVRRASRADRDRAAQRLRRVHSLRLGRRPRRRWLASRSRSVTRRCHCYPRSSLQAVAGRGDAGRRARPAPRPAGARLRQPRRHTVTRRGRPADPRRRRPRRDGARQHARPPDRADGRGRCVAGGRRTQGGPDELLRQARRDARHVRGQRVVDVRLPRSDPSVAARDHGDGRGARRRRRPRRGRRLRRTGPRALVARPGVGVRDDRRSRRLGVAGDDRRIRRWSVAPTATSPS